MNAQMKKDLENVVNSVINEDTDKAISSFKTYLKEKTKEILETQVEPEDESDEDEWFIDEFGHKHQMISGDEAATREDERKYGRRTDPDYSGPGSKGYVGH
jgi:hypothetical protein